MPDSVTTIAELKASIRSFAAIRGWEPYHTPKNLVLALASEVGELCHLMRWWSPEESQTRPLQEPERTATADELADIANIVFLLAVRLELDLSEVVARKMAKNAEKYPAPSVPED